MSTLDQRIEAPRVLVVDGDPFMAANAVQMLAHAGISDVRVARDSADALAIVERPLGTPDLIVCALDGNGQDGLLLIHSLADRAFHGQVVVTSGSDYRMMASLAAVAAESGLRVAATLSTPLDSAALGRMLADFRSTAPEGAGPEWLPPAIDLAGLDARLAAGAPMLAIQPLVMLGDRRVVGGEVLIRWNDAEHGVVAPAAIIAAAEATGRIDAVTNEVFRQAAAWFGYWNRMGTHLRVSVNVSIRNLDRVDLPGRLLTLCETAGIAPEQMVIEITESGLLESSAVARGVIARLHLHGFGLSIDNFGTGYSSVEDLRNGPFSEVKIDRQFLRGVHDSIDARELIEAAIARGRAVGLPLVVGGIETLEDWQLAQQLDFDLAQGYYIATPMDPALFLSWKAGWDRAIAHSRVAV